MTLVALYWNAYQWSSDKGGCELSFRKEALSVLLLLRSLGFFYSDICLGHRNVSLPCYFALFFSASLNCAYNVYQWCPCIDNADADLWMYFMLITHSHNSCHTKCQKNRVTYQDFLIVVVCQQLLNLNLGVQKSQNKVYRWMFFSAKDH